MNENINTQHRSKPFWAFKYIIMLNYVMYRHVVYNFTDQMLPMTFPLPDKDGKI